MSAPIVQCVRHLIEEYRRFLRSSYRLADPHLREQFEQHVNETDVLVKGPYITLSRDFTTEHTLEELIKGGVGHPDLARLKWSFGNRPIYKHQEMAFRLVEQQDRNCIVKTGTGSGKTEAFLLALLSGVMKLREKGIHGTKAIIIYPMNALANDQLKRLREIIRDAGVKITFGMYTGDSETVARTIGEPLEGNEVVDRAQIRKESPDIILTNYKELEFMLVRKADRKIFSPALRYLILDEIHTYRGALATEIACLIRRLKARCSLKEGQLRCVGTSATVSEGAGGDEALARFSSSLFGEPFEVSDIVGEVLVAYQKPATTYRPPLPVLDPVLLSAISSDETGAVLELAQRITGKSFPQEGSLPRKIAATFHGNELVDFMSERCGEPSSLSELAAQVQERFPEARDLSKANLITLLEAYVLIGSLGTDDHPPVLRPKLHTFFHGVYDVGLCMNPDCRLLVKDGSEVCSQCQSVVRPAALCRTCGQDFVKIRFQDDPDEPPVANDIFQSDESTGFVTPRVHIEADDEEGADTDGRQEEARREARRRPTPTRQRLVDVWVCHLCGRVYEAQATECGHCDVSGTVTRQKMIRGDVNTCPVCNSTSPRGEILTLLRTGVASSNSLLATHHIDLLDETDRKLLLFADNRQEAAHQAGYTNDRHRLFTLRHAIAHVLLDQEKKGLSIKDLPFRLLEKFQDMSLASRRLNSSERDKWLLALEFKIASEFCRGSHKWVSLENLAVIAVEYEFLDELTKDRRFLEISRQAGISHEDAMVLVKAILDRMRRTRAVDFSFFQEYINPTKDKWMMLAQEPYSLIVPERECNPVFYMLDRNEEARNKPGGFQFDALVKDVSRGGGSAIPKMLARAGIAEHNQDSWLRQVVKLLKEYEILVTPTHVPPRVRGSIGRGEPLQVASRVMRLLPAGTGYRCRKCQTWHPYRGLSCYSTRCTGGLDDLEPSEMDKDHYYVRMYTRGEPKKMRVGEHTAQIDQDQRAKREKDFKENRLNILVCSPTLELGVDIGDLQTVLLRNCPPTPANYIQRAGRAGRRLRIGFVSTFCGFGSHDRHCFEDPAWLVRGEYYPPTVRLENNLIMARHIRSYVLENLESEFPGLMGDLVDDLDNPKNLNEDKVKPIGEEIRSRSDMLIKGACAAFGARNDEEKNAVAKTIQSMQDEIDRILNKWFDTIRRLSEEFKYYDTITADRRARQKADARRRAYGELTTAQQTAYVLNYLANEGLLPSYQFPTDTFSLEPGVNDTPTLRRPSWIALFEFAPGNLVYANGHKLKTIRALFEGRNRGAGQGSKVNLESSGRVRSISFCASCGYASEEVLNNCPQCDRPLENPQNVAFIEEFEAEQYTQISSEEEIRERTYFERKEHLVHSDDLTVKIYPYPFAHLEMCHRARILVTNWGKRSAFGGEGEKFELCQGCGKHRSRSLRNRQRENWEQEHRRLCSGEFADYVLGYEFSSDALVLPVPEDVIRGTDDKVFARTLGSALVAGAVEFLEIEADEIAFFHHLTGQDGLEVIFYETAPGGSGYLETLASRLPEWADFAIKRLNNHDCVKACYRCLKSYRNQPFHNDLNKGYVQDALFQYANGESIGEAVQSSRHEGIKQSGKWIQEERSKVPTEGTVIEQKLLAAIREKGRLPDPVAQRAFQSKESLITVADFAYEKEKIAIYCDGFAYHGTKDALAKDAYKRNFLQAEGWAVLTFWGRTILKHPDRCEEQVWQVYKSRKS